MAAASDLAPLRASSSWRGALAAGWRWWTAELGGLVPERFAIFGRGSRVPVLAVDAQELTLVEPRLPRGETRLALSSLDPARQAAAVRSLLESAGETRARARLCLDRAEALVRRVTMPAATEENLPQVLAFEMDRLTPFAADDVYFDHRIVSRDVQDGTITVQIGVARRDLVDRRVERLRAWNVNVQGVVLRDEAGTPAALDLLPTEQRGERESATERMLQRGLLVLVLVLAVAALLLPAWRKREAILALYPRVDRARQEAEAASRIANELEREVSNYNFLLARKHSAYPALAVIEEISRLLPDNTWVQQLDLKTVGKMREVQVTGETASSSRLIELFEQSQMLQNATPRGTVSRGSQPGTERFSIAAEVRARPKPDATPVLELPPAPTPAARRGPAQSAPPPQGTPPAGARPGPAPQPARVSPGGAAR